MKELFNIHPRDKKPLFLITVIFILVNLIWAFYSDNTWDDDCPARFQNTVHALSDAKQFVNLWNRPLFVTIFALPVQLGAWTIPVIQTLFSVIAGFSLYQVARDQKLKFAYLAFPLLAFQPFVFGVSRYAMTEPLAITLICLSLFFQVKKKWNAFALCGALLPLARMELAIFFPFYAIALFNAKKHLSILILGIPGILWALVGGLINSDLLWIVDETFGKEKKENRYGHQPWDTYLSRYQYVVGPVLIFFSFLGSLKTWKVKFLRLFVLIPFLLGFFVYTLFSWKLNMGNAAGFLRNIIPISPFLALICLAGIGAWFSFANHRGIKIKKIVLPKKSPYFLTRAKRWNTVISNGKFYGLIILAFSVGITYLFFIKKLELHHKIIKDKFDYSLLITGGILLIFSILMLFLKRKILNVIVPSFVFLIVSSYTLVTEHPMANSSQERELISKYAKFYNNSYLSERTTHVNHPWFLWCAGLDRFDSRMKMMKKDSLKEAKVGTIALFETHYSARLSGDVSQGFLSRKKDWIEISRKITLKRNFVMSTYEKVNGKEDYEKAHFKFIEATDSLDAAAFYCLGNTYISKLKNIEKAYEAFGKAINVDSTYSDGFLGLGMAMAQKRNHKAAIEFYNKGLKISPRNFNILLQKGVAQINLKQFTAAIKTLKRAGEVNIKDYNSWFYVGLAYQNQNKAKKSLKAYEKCLQKNPKFAQAWQNVAIIQYKTKNKKAACINIKKAVKFGSTTAKRIEKQFCGGK